MCTQLILCTRYAWRLIHVKGGFASKEMTKPAMPNQAKMSPVGRAALRVVSREMRRYDALSQPARIRYERSAVQAIDDGLLCGDGLRECAHSVPLHKPCQSCQRTEQDCRTYERLAIARLTELLALLEQ
jgi:hypothetical protein